MHNDVKRAVMQDDMKRTVMHDDAKSTEIHYVVKNYFLHTLVIHIVNGKNAYHWVEQSDAKNRRFMTSCHILMSPVVS